MSRIDTSLAHSPPGLWPFIVAGYPSLDATAQLLHSLAKLPIRGVEIGFPFSDPVADGPVIQQAFHHALEGGVRIADVFTMLGEARDSCAAPLMGMVSASIVHRVGGERFVESAAQSGLDGLIVPDVPLEESGELASLCAARDLRFPMLVAPTTPAERCEKIARAASGFLYYVSVQGTTGQRDRLPEGLESRVRELREQTKMPVLVGFGISNRQQVRDVCRFADGGIVGSAIVQRMAREIDRGAGEQAVMDAAVEFIGELVER